MTNCEPSNITEARNLLRDFEHIDDHSVRTRKFEDALELLDPYLPEDNSQVSHIAANLRRTYTRKLLEQLSCLHFLDIDDWFSYAMLLLTKLNNEVDAICSEDRVSENALNAFITIWADEARELIQRNKPKT